MPSAELSIPAMAKRSSLNVPMNRSLDATFIREEIVRLLGEGCTRTQIAKELGIDRKTVYRHIRMSDLKIDPIADRRRKHREKTITLEDYGWIMLKCMSEENHTQYYHREILMWLHMHVNEGESLDYACYNVCRRFSINYREVKKKIDNLEI